jgi:hypothetical protein
MEIFFQTICGNRPQTQEGEALSLPGSGGLVRQQSGALATLEHLAAIPEEELWLQNQRSATFFANY